MTVLINEEELAFSGIGSPQVNVGVFGFTAAWKKFPDLQIVEIIGIPKYVYLLSTVQCWHQAHSIG